MIGRPAAGGRDGFDADADTPELLAGGVLVAVLLTTLLLQLVATANAVATTAVVRGSRARRAVSVRCGQPRRGRPAQPTMGQAIPGSSPRRAPILPAPSDPTARCKNTWPRVMLAPAVVPAVGVAWIARRRVRILVRQVSLRAFHMVRRSDSSSVWSITRSASGKSAGTTSNQASGRTAPTCVRCAVSK